VAKKTAHVSEAEILRLDRSCIHGGRRGDLIGIAPRVLDGLLAATPVSCAQLAP
jgi:prolyl-tRNA editing enzyme YbaK/EbsC (Cys-tRNA(Pro) deacylase)